MEVVIDLRVGHPAGPVNFERETAPVLGTAHNPGCGVAPDPSRRHGRPRAVSPDRLLPAPPADSARDLARALEHRGLLRLDCELGRGARHGKAFGRPAQVPVGPRAIFDPRVCLRALGGEPLPWIHRLPRLSDRRRGRSAGPPGAPRRSLPALPRAAAARPDRGPRRNRDLERDGRGQLRHFLLGELHRRPLRARARVRRRLSRLVRVPGPGADAAGLP